MWHFLHSLNSWPYLNKMIIKVSVLEEAGLVIGKIPSRSDAPIDNESPISQIVNKVHMQEMCDIGQFYINISDICVVWSTTAWFTLFMTLSLMTIQKSFHFWIFSDKSFWSLLDLDLPAHWPVNWMCCHIFNCTITSQKLRIHPRDGSPKKEWIILNNLRRR